MAAQIDKVQNLQSILTVLVAVSTIRGSVAEDCGGNYTALEGWITSPHYPDHYTNNTDCIYSIVQPTGYRVTLYFWDFHVEPHVSCASDFVKIYDGDSLSSPLLGSRKFCGSKLPPIQRTTGNTMLIQFHSNLNLTDSGFNISYVAAVIPQEFLLMASYLGKIYRFDIRTMSHILVPVEGVFMAMAIDYDPVDDRIYWTDTSLKEIHSASLSGLNIKVVRYLGPGKTSGTLDGIRLDTQSRLIFYTDAGNQVIGLLTMTTFEQKLLITTDLDKPRAIVLDIINGLMFWTDWGATPKLERANYDGTDRRILVSTLIIKPDGLALDTAKNIIYWTDSGTDRLESMTMDGMNRTRLAVFPANPFYLGLVLHNDELYITHWATNGSTTILSYILRMKTNPINATIIIEGNEDRVNGLAIYPAPTGPNMCSNGKGGCSHICIPCNGNITQCLCPNGQYLSDDQKTCLSQGRNMCANGNGGCSHICNTFNGNIIQCSCPNGQYLSNDQKTCLSQGPEPINYPLIGGSSGGGLALIILIIVIVVIAKKRGGSPTYDRPKPQQQLSSLEMSDPYATISREIHNNEDDRNSNIYVEIVETPAYPPNCLANYGYLHPTYNLRLSASHYAGSVDDYLQPI